MYDNHTFKKLPCNPKEAYKQALECFDQDPWGSFGIAEKGDQRLVAHGNGSRCDFSKQLDEYFGPNNGYGE
jgi:hypothetical protein